MPSGSMLRPCGSINSGASISTRRGVFIPVPTWDSHSRMRCTAAPVRLTSPSTGRPILTDPQTILLGDLPPGAMPCMSPVPRGFSPLAGSRLKASLLSTVSKTQQPIRSPFSGVGGPGPRYPTQYPCPCRPLLGVGEGTTKPLNVFQQYRTTLEIPEAFHAGLEYYVLSKVREAEQSRGKRRA